MPVRYWVLILAIGTVWGGSFLFNAILIRELSPFWVSAGRITVGALGCWVFFFATGRRLPKALGLYAGLLLLGALNFAIPFALFPFAEIHLPSGLVAVLNALTPMTTVLVSQVWPGGERAGWNKYLGILVGFAGTAVLAGPSLGTGSALQLLAIGACLLASVLYAIALNYARRFNGVDPATVASVSLTAAAILTIPVALFAPCLGFGPQVCAPDLPTITRPETWAALLAIGLISTTLAFLLMYRILPKVGATNFSINTFVTPVSGILLGTLLLGERFEGTQLIGIAVIFAGLLLIDGRLFRRRSVAAAG